MNMQFEKVALVGRHSDERVAEPMRLISAHLNDAGIDVMSESGQAAAVGARAITAAQIAAEADLIIAIGGDGTLLHAASLTGDADIPLLGVNRGRLGFLTDVSPDEMLESIDQIFAGSYVKESRLRLHATISRGDETISTGVALNDVVLQRRDTGRILDFKTRIADRYVNTHMADGLIVATPTGSTAYSLSCGGPIVEPQLDAVVVIPICPHTLSDRPIVVPANRQIEVCLLERGSISAEIIVDGHSIGVFSHADKLVIRRASQSITLLHPPGYDYYEILRSKLNWGRDSRIRHGGNSDAETSEE